MTTNIKRGSEVISTRLIQSMNATSNSSSNLMEINFFLFLRRVLNFLNLTFYWIMPTKITITQIVDLS
jgi:hypothetical protein